MGKLPIYSHKLLHGILFDTGLILIPTGSIILLFCRTRKPRQLAKDLEP
jgi:hypothetical protein